MAKYWGYCRISTLHQHDTSLSAQADYLRTRATELGLEFMKIEEKVSGAKFEERSEFIKVINNSQAGDIMGVYDDSRFGRETSGNLDYLEKLTNKGVKLESHGRIIDYNNAIDKMIFSMGSVFATYQRDIQRQKSLEGIAKKKEEGNWVLRGDLFGYDLKYDKGRPVITINEKEAKYIRTLFEEYANGASSLSLVRKYKDAVFAECNFRLGPDSINRLLFKPIYMGYYTANSLSTYDKTEKKTRDYTRISRLGEENLRKELVKSNLYEPIVSEELWFKCYNSYRTVTRKNATQFAYRDSPYELTSVIHTSCNCHASFIHSNSKKGFYGEVYKPTKHNKDCNDKSFKTLRADLIEPIMRMTYFLTFYRAGHLKSYITEQQNNIEESQKELKRQEEEINDKIAELDKEKKNLVDFIRKNGSDADIEKDIKSINEDKESLKRQLDKVKESMTLSSNSWLKALGNFCLKALDEFKNAETAEKRRDLYLKYCTAEMSRDTLTVEYFNTEKFVVHWHFTRTGHEKPFEFENYWRGELERTGTIEPLSKTVKLNLNEWEKDYDSFIAHFPEGYFDGGEKVWNEMFPNEKVDDWGRFVFNKIRKDCSNTEKKATEYLRSIEDRSPRELLTE